MIRVSGLPAVGRAGQFDRRMEAPVEFSAEKRWAECALWSVAAAGIDERAGEVIRRRFGYEPAGVVSWVICAAATRGGGARGRSDGVRVGEAIRCGGHHVPGRGSVEAAAYDR